MSSSDDWRRTGRFNKLLGIWAAEKLGMAGRNAEAYLDAPTGAFPRIGDPRRATGPAHYAWTRRPGVSVTARENGTRVDAAIDAVARTPTRCRSSGMPIFSTARALPQAKTATSCVKST